MNKLMITAALMMASLGAHAASTFSSFDKNDDGFISKSEAAVSTELSSEFDKLDSNGDGKLSKQEFRL
ncbi:calmodulin [Pseudoalteromonas rubra]|uniref:Calmodulin n=1 Tax=Pseudoalteromonas rubra TaxID=43658 RepID=A0A5S3WLK9_9GAMM|nr:EF-hand domain-containing protein [Pseudoalteromonas rubra]TMP28410.1 calmodulin [Pseudoalteromonas rubra]TMP37187.1 calmodulin [Pseudoalteromonas rubra]